MNYLADRRAVLRARRRVRVMLGLVVVGAGGAILALLLPFLPYRAMTIYSLRPEQEKACPLDVLAFERDYRVWPNANLDRVIVEPFWIAVDVPGVRKGSRLDLDLEIPYTEEELRPGRRTGQTSVLLPAPLKPGKWRVASETTAYGRPYLLPLSQTLEVRAKETIQILPLAEPGCGEGET